MKYGTKYDLFFSLRKYLKFGLVPEAEKAAWAVRIAQEVGTILINFSNSKFGSSMLFIRCVVPSNALILTPFFGKTFFLKFVLVVPLKIFEDMSKVSTAGVELPNLVT
jgi:hypothetical protein